MVFEENLDPIVIEFGFLSLSQLGVYLGKYTHIIMNIVVRTSIVGIGGFRHKIT